MKKYIQFIKEMYDINEESFEKKFLELSHLDVLEIKIDFIVYPKDLYYFYNDHLLFNIYKKCM